MLSKAICATHQQSAKFEPFASNPTYLVSGFPQGHTSNGQPGTYQYDWNHPSWLATEARQFPIAQSQVKMQKQKEEEKMREATLHTQDMD